MLDYVSLETASTIITVAFGFYLAKKMLK